MSTSDISETSESETLSWVEYYVWDANGNLQGPWELDACIKDVESGKGGIRVVMRSITEVTILERKPT